MILPGIRFNLERKGQHEDKKQAKTWFDVGGGRPSGPLGKKKKKREKLTHLGRKKEVGSRAKREVTLLGKNGRRRSQRGSSQKKEKDSIYRRGQPRRQR